LRQSIRACERQSCILSRFSGSFSACVDASQAARLPVEAC
jgi:hypothetical protein